MHSLKARKIIFCGVLQSDRSTLADVNAEHAVWAMRLKMLCERCCSVVIKTSAVNQSFILRKTKQSRARIAGLRYVRHRAYFNKAEAQRRQIFSRRPVLIKPCCKTNRICETQSEALQLSKRRAHKTPACDSSSPLCRERY